MKFKPGDLIVDPFDGDKLEIISYNETGYIVRDRINKFGYRSRHGNFPLYKNTTERWFKLDIIDIKKRDFKKELEKLYQNNTE